MSLLLIPRLGVAMCVLIINIMPAQANQSTASQVLTLNTAIGLAQRNDHWLLRSQHTQAAIEAMSIAADTLPDPTVSMRLENVPSDSFDFNQEAMTQFKVGVAQRFPRGNSLTLEKHKLKLSSRQHALQQQDRKAKVAVSISELWLDLYKIEKSIALVTKNRALFEQLVDISQANYASALGKTRQQDIVSAQLSLTQLDDRLLKLKQKQGTLRQALDEWLNEQFTVQHLSASASVNFLPLSHNWQLAKTLPAILPLQAQLFTSQDLPIQTLANYFLNHPALKALEKNIKSHQAGVDLAKQKYKPEWGLNASYGYRDDTAMGVERADLFSVGVTFTLPLFTHNKQDKQVKSAVSKREAVKINKLHLLSTMITSFKTQQIRLRQLNQRQQLYREKLLPQAHEQAEASLTAYTNDDGNFAEVVRARIHELNAEIDALDINVETQKTIAQLNYFFVETTIEKEINNQDDLVTADSLAIKNNTDNMTDFTGEKR